MQLSMFNAKRLRKIGLPFLFFGLALILTSCAMTMREQPKLNPLTEDPFYANQAAARPLMPETVARGYSQTETAAEQMLQDFGEEFPFEVTQENLERGQQRFDIYCSPCHDRLGTGNGMIVQRGFSQPTSFHDDRLRTSPPSYFYGAMTNGFGAMPSYANRITPKDRWLIAAYIQALQLSQNATLDDVPTAEQNQLEGSK